MAAIEDELRSLDERSLVQRIKQATRSARALSDAPDPGEPMERERVLEELGQQASIAQAARAELKGREVERGMSAAKQRQLERWLASDDHKRPGEAAQKALTIHRGEFPPPLERDDFNVGRLSKKEGEELLALTRRGFSGELTAKELPRKEALLEKCAGRPGAIERHRNPPRPPLPEMPTREVAMPSYLLAWIVSDPRHTQLSTFRLGYLWKVVAGLQNRQPVVVRSRIEELDGQTYMVCPGTERLRVDAADGSLEQPRAMQYLADQGLLSLERTDAGEIRVGFGPKLRKFRDQEGGETNGD